MKAGWSTSQYSLFRNPDLKKIARFSGKWRFCSNFFVEPDGTLVEREYQAAKCKNPSDTNRFSSLGGRASKDLGRAIELRDDWDRIRVEVMAQFVLQKFRDHPDLRERLLETEDWLLEEGNSHGDQFWGVVDGVGENHLGKILMWARTMIK